MVGNRNTSSSKVYGSGSHGSSVASYDDPLDRERAASMADEGGAAGAVTDALEQHRTVGAVQRARAVQRMRLRAGLILAAVGIAFVAYEAGRALRS